MGPAARSALDELSGIDFEPSKKDLPTAVSLPPDLYRTQWAYEIEKEYIFRREWIYVCRESDLAAPGDYVAKTLIDEPFIIVRKDDGTLSAFSAVCRHRAMVVVEGSGTCPRLFRCPYHSWTYDHEGRLVGLPGMDGRDLDRSRFSMPRFKAESWHGFIFINFDRGAAPLAELLRPVEYLVERHGLESLVDVVGRETSLEVNWKTMAENNAECYHCEHLHHETHKVAPTRNVIPHLTPEGSPAIVTRTRTTHRDAAFSADWKPHFPILPNLGEEERNHFTWIQILPTFMLSLYHDQAGYWAVYPTGPSSIDIHVGRLFPESTVARPDFEQTHETIRQEMARIWDEDRWATLMVQKGRRSHFVNRGPYAELDEGVVALNRWLVERYERAGIATS